MSPGSDPTDTEPSDFIEEDEDGPYIDWVGLAGTISGSLILAWAIGVIEWIQTVSAGIVTALGGFGQWASSLVWWLWEIPAGLINASWASTASWVSQFGLSAYPLSIAITAVVIVAATWVVLWAGETVLGVT